VLAINESEKYLLTRDILTTIDYRLNFEDQIKLLTAKISRSIDVLYKLRHTLPVTALCNQYYSTIHPHLLYGIVIWSNAYEKHLKKTQNFRKQSCQITNWSSVAGSCHTMLLKNEYFETE